MPLTTRYSAVADAGGTLGKEALPASLLLVAVVYAATALFRGAKVALVCAVRGAGPTQLPLTDLNASTLTHA